jgi:hypothetical protein
LSGSVPGASFGRSKALVGACSARIVAAPVSAMGPQGWLQGLGVIVACGCDGSLHGERSVPLQIDGCLRLREMRCRGSGTGGQGCSQPGGGWWGAVLRSQPALAAGAAQCSGGRRFLFTTFPPVAAAAPLPSSTVLCRRLCCRAGSAWEGQPAGPAPAWFSRSGRYDEVRIPRTGH